MPAAKITLPVIEKGADYLHHVRWLQSDGVTPVDMSGLFAKMQVRETVDSNEVLVELSTDNQRIAIDIPTAKITLSIPYSVTSSLKAAKSAVYDLELYNLATSVRLMEGKVTIKSEVTR